MQVYGQYAVQFYQLLNMRFFTLRSNGKAQKASLALQIKTLYLIV